MLILLHKNARTTPATRREIAESQDSVSVLSSRYGVGERTIRRWKGRTEFGDRSHTAHRLQTTLSPGQEAIVVALRKTLLLSLDDLLAVTREFICAEASRSGLDRCLRRHGVGNLNQLRAVPEKPKPAAFKSYRPGYVHIDIKYLPHMADETQRSYLFVAIDRATRWVYVAIKSSKSAANARAFLRELHQKCPIKIQKILTDNGKEFTDRLFTSRPKPPTGQHEFDKLCTELSIEHRLSPPRSPQTNGMVERFNGRISDILRTHHFISGEDLRQTLKRYVYLYNHQIPQYALNSLTPFQTMANYYQSNPESFRKKPSIQAGCDTYSLLYFATAAHLQMAKKSAASLAYFLNKLKEFLA